MIIFKKPFIYLTLTVILILFLLIGSFFIPRPKQPDSKQPFQTSFPDKTIFPAISPSRARPPLTEDLTYKPEEQGGGIDIESEKVQGSIAEIKKLIPFLPYEENLTLSSGKQVSLLVPGKEFQTIPWVLEVQIFGPNYRVTEKYEEYEGQKKDFLEAASFVFGWIKSRGGRPDSIIISWGDQSFIQENAEKWLKAQ